MCVCACARECDCMYVWWSEWVNEGVCVCPHNAFFCCNGIIGFCHCVDVGKKEKKGLIFFSFPPFNCAREARIQTMSGFMSKTLAIPLRKSWRRGWRRESRVVLRGDRVRLTKGKDQSRCSNSDRLELKCWTTLVAFSVHEGGKKRLWEKKKKMEFAGNRSKKVQTGREFTKDWLYSENNMELSA